MSLTKFLLVTDRYVDLKNFRATLEHILARTNPQTDLYVFSNRSMDTLDYTGPAVNEGSKGVWLGLGDPEPGRERRFQRGLAPARMSGQEAAARVFRRGPGGSHGRARLLPWLPGDRRTVLPGRARGRG